MAKISDFLTAKITRKSLDGFIAKYSSDENEVLDLGCGDASYRQYFKRRVGFDARPGKYTDVVGDAHQLPFSSERFDLILCTELLEHMHSPQVAAAEMKRVLKAGGILLLTTRFIFPLHDVPNDYFRFTKYGLRFLFNETDWEILELKEESSTKDILAILLQRIGFQTKLRGGKLSKLFIFLIARIILLLPNLIKEEFGDIRHSRQEKNILTSGYYLACRKK